MDRKVNLIQTRKRCKYDFKKERERFLKTPIETLDPQKCKEFLVAIIYKAIEDYQSKDEEKEYSSAKRYLFHDDFDLEGNLIKEDVPNCRAICELLGISIEWIREKLNVWEERVNFQRLLI